MVWNRLTREQNVTFRKWVSLFTLRCSERQSRMEVRCEERSTSFIPCALAGCYNPDGTITTTAPLLWNSWFVVEEIGLNLRQLYYIFTWNASLHPTPTAPRVSSKRTSVDIMTRMGFLSLSALVCIGVPRAPARSLRNSPLRSLRTFCFSMVKWDVLCYFSAEEPLLTSRHREISSTWRHLRFVNNKNLAEVEFRNGLFWIWILKPRPHQAFVFVFCSCFCSY